jgi:SAM-dependent methyltransferase
MNNTKTEIKKKYVFIDTPKQKKINNQLIRAFIGMILSPLNLIRSLSRKGVGSRFHLAISIIAISLLGSKISPKKLYRMICAPMDSVRYFEFDYFWGLLNDGKNLGNYLDISSPRLFSFRLLKEGVVDKLVLANPDKKDLEETATLYQEAKLNSKVLFLNQNAKQLAVDAQKFDTIVSISVLEHIPYEYLQENLESIWNILAPGGRLIISLPCCKKSYDEYINIDEYGLLSVNKDGYVFGQTFYNQDLIDIRFKSIFGEPSRYKIFGEKIDGTFIEDRRLKLVSQNYPFWSESLRIMKGYDYYESIDDLPGLGVIAMEFEKK